MDEASRSIDDGETGGYFDGALAAIDVLRPVLAVDSPELLTTVNERVETLDAALNGAGEAQLSPAIDALATALSQVHAVIAAGNARIKP
jgi:hypothetical protein